MITVLHHGTSRRNDAGLSHTFARTPLDALTDPELRPPHIVAISWLDWYSFRGSGLYPGHDALAADLRMSRRHTYEILAHLADTGWISRQGNGPGATCSIVFPNPQRELAGVRYSAPQGAPQRTLEMNLAALLECATAHPSEDPTLDILKKAYTNAGGSEADWEAARRGR
jgi:hypothetical protein